MYALMIIDFLALSVRKVLNTIQIYILTMVLVILVQKVALTMFL